MLKKDDEKTIIKTLESCTDFGDAQVYYKELRKFGIDIKKNEEVIEIINFLEAIGKDDRLYIITALKEKDRCVCELEAILQKSQPSVSHHLKILEKANLIRGWKKGKFTHYSLIKSNFIRFNKILSEFLGNISNWFGEIII